MQPSKSFWTAACIFGAVMALLYGLELLKISLLVFSHDRLSAEVTLREDSPAMTEIHYNYTINTKAFDGEKLYRFPETLFLEDLREGEKIEVLVYRAYPFFSLPVKLLWFEVLFTLVLVILAGLLTAKAWRERGEPGAPDDCPKTPN